MLQIVKVPVASLQLNNGQIEGVPKNPRLIKDARYKELLQSLRDRPAMTEIKPLWVYDNVVVSGNMRLRAVKELKWKEVPVIQLPKETPKEDLCAYVILDNTHYGEHDWDALGNEWSDKPLIEWGITQDYVDQEPEPDDEAKQGKDITCPHCGETFKK
jgi:ParB-like chromosome segregation protein Spo0J